jgi:hypothetical protein
MVEMLEQGDKAALLQSYKGYFAALGRRLQGFQMTPPSSTPPHAPIARVKNLQLEGRLDGLK